MTREIDREIAEKVMGWKLGKPEWCHGPMMHGGSFIRFWLDKDGQYAKHGATIFSEQWNPSTDIFAAWQVVEKMREKGRHFLFMMSHESGLSIASFYLGPHDRNDLSATEEFDKASLAICRAALKAVENKQ